MPPDEEVRERVVFPTGTLVVETLAGAQVFLDGKPLGRAPLEPLEVNVDS